jgi:uncharacterized protein YjbI with pentapeptide repeats
MATWPTCSECGGARIQERHCITHLTESEWANEIKRLRAGGPLDARGAAINAKLLHTILDALVSDVEGPLSLPPADFSDAQFSDAVNFGDAQFSGVVNFGNTQFSGAVDFGNAQFSGAINFCEAQFSDAVNFCEAQFSDAVNFREAQFSYAVNFGNAQFSGIVDFREAQFSDAVNFDKVNRPGFVGGWSFE